MKLRWCEYYFRLRHAIYYDHIACLGTNLSSLELMIISFYLYAYFSMYLSKINSLLCSRNVNLSICLNSWSILYISLFSWGKFPEALCHEALHVWTCCSPGFLQSSCAQITFAMIVDSVFNSNVMDLVFLGSYLFLFLVFSLIFLDHVLR